jgi:hypothetical protein
MIDQAWQGLRGRQPDIERIFKEGPVPGDETLLQGVVGYVLAQMTLVDHDLEES